MPIISLKPLRLLTQNVWVRHGAVGFVAAVAKTLNIADVHCNLLPLIQPFLKLDVIQLDEVSQMNMHFCYILLCVID